MPGKVKIKKPNPARLVLLFKQELWIRDYSVRMQRWFSKLPQAPLRIDAELHRRCNLRCIQCSRRADEEKGVDLNKESKKFEVKDSRWIQIARESGKMKVKAWNIAGVSEPFYKPSLTIKIMEELKKSAIFGEITTNGTLLKEKDIRHIAEIKWDCVNVSVDSPRAELHDYLRGGFKGTFDQAAETVQLLRYYRDMFGCEQPCIFINVVLNRYNYKDLTKLAKMCAWLGADALFVEPMMVYTERGRQLKLGPKEIKELPPIIEATKEIGKEKNIMTFISCIEEDDEQAMREFKPELVEKTSEFKDVIVERAMGTEKLGEHYELVEDPDHVEEAKKAREMGFSDRALIERILKIPCYYPWFFLMITANGSAVHCGECTDLRHNIKKESLHEIWYGKHMERLRKQYARGSLPNYCNRCRPNVINDIQMVRKSILEYANIHNLQHELVNLLRENEELKVKLAKKSTHSTKIHKKVSG